MVHTLLMRLLRQISGIFLVGLVTVGLSGWAQTNLVAQGKAHGLSNWQHAVDQALSTAPGARVLVLDIGSGDMLASAHLAEASRTLATPGSTLKPLVLYFALQSTHWNPERRIACNRQLHLGSHQLNCSHPVVGPMDAQQALAWSCNSYFAELAGTLAPEQLREALSGRRLLAATGLAPQESMASYREPRTREQIQLAALGVEGIRVTLPELAEAYRSLAIELAAHPETIAAKTLIAGLTDSASFGMAGAASLSGVPIAGKTGTASAENGGVTHGWFVGFAPVESPRVVVAVYLPSGHGSDAALVAARVLAISPLRKP
jgi:cell division protein FtsI/penicillin-binding protein 2